jgi:hypothetical protein
MHRLIKPIFWVFLFLVMILIIDQFLVQVPPVHPAHATVSTFYRDFRNRMIDLVFGERTSEPQSIEAVIETQQNSSHNKAHDVGKATKKIPSSASPVKSKAPQRYIYSDSKGELQFADSLEEVPKEYRGQAQPMAE